MEKNYYEILQVDKNASSEIIEKAYKTLVKKYHPDLQENNLKENYEEKIKKINEAYEILSDEEKRKNYDLNLKNNFIPIEEFNNLYNENINLKKQLNYLKNTLSNINNYSNKINNEKINYNNLNNYNINKNNYEKNNLNNNYSEKNNINNNFYYNNLKNRKIKNKNNFKIFSKNILALIITIFIILFIGFILWHIPATKNYLINLYNENGVLKFFVDLFFSIF